VKKVVPKRFKNNNLEIDSDQSENISNHQ